jgi:hypothetical protein
VVAVSGSGCSVCMWRTVHWEVADSPRGAEQPSFLRVCRVILSAFISIRFIWCFWLLVGWQTVRDVSSDSLLGADDPRVEDGWSVFRGALLEVWEPFLDIPPVVRGQSAWCPWTVHPILVDGPSRPLQIA